MSKYKGNLKDNKQCGKGVYYFEDGQKYIGECNNYLKEGKGKYFLADCKIYFRQFYQ